MYDKLIEQYNRDGIAVIPNLFSDAECERMKGEAYSLRGEDVTAAGYPHKPTETAYNKLSLVFFPALANDYLDQVRTDERMVQVVRAFLGDNVKQVNNQVYFREAGDRDEFAWHQDIVFREPRHRFPGIETGYLQTIIAVDDITEDNGAVEFIKGSHLQGEQDITSNPALTKMLRSFRRMGLQGEKYLAPKGSLLLWSVLTVHGSEANQSDQDRMTYMNGFARSENCLDYPDYLIDGLPVPLNHKLIP